MLVDLVWVDFDIGVLASILLSKSILAYSKQPKQDVADRGTLKIKVDPTQLHEQMRRPLN